MMHLKYLLLLLLCQAYWGFSQNIDGLPVHVARIAPAYIKFSDKIKTAEFSTASAYDNYLIRVRNDDNTLIIQYTGNNPHVIDEGLTITEGSRRHFFIVSFLKEYDINKHKQLYYTFDDLKQLKQLLQQQPSHTAPDKEVVANAMEQLRLQEESERQQELAQAEKLRQQQALQRKKALEKDKKIQAEKEKQENADFAKAQKEQARIEKEKQAAIQKEKTLQAEKDKIAQQQIAEEKKKQLEAEKQAALEKARQELLAKQQQEEAHKAKVEALKKAQDQAAEDKKYSPIGLWNRYGKHGINVYEIPDDQKNWVNTDFYIAKDTQYNFAVAQDLLKRPGQNIKAAYGSFHNGVTLELQDMIFKGPFTYYKIKITNPTSDDFLTGGVVTEIYDKDKQHKQQIKTSYFTHINFYPIVRPQTEQYVVMVTRTPVLEEGDDLIIYMTERRADRGRAYILLKGRDIHNEADKVEKVIQPVKKGSNKTKKKKK